MIKNAFQRHGKIQFFVKDAKGNYYYIDSVDYFRCQRRKNKIIKIYERGK